ncbi:hypothetical protein BGX26_003155, partial [Mortierella sp. AD094]
MEPNMTALNLPEIRTHIGRFLNTADLARCVCVNKAWNNSFLLYLWSRLDITGLPLPYKKAFARQKNQLAFLSQHRHLIKHLRLRQFLTLTSYHLNIRDHPFASFGSEHYTFPILEEVTLVNLSAGFVEEAIKWISKSPSICRLHIENLHTPLPSFWGRLAEFSGIVHLHLESTKIDPAAAESFYAICGRLRTLKLRCVTLPLLQLPIAYDAFRRLQVLRMEEHVYGLSSKELVELIASCSELETLEWTNPCRRIHGPFLESVYLFSDLTVGRTWSRLENLRLRYAHVEDESLAKILGTLTRIRSLDVEGTGFGYFSFQILRFHFGNIEELNLYKCKSATGTMMSEILQSSPKLRVFKGRRILGKDAFSIQNDGVHRPWVCTSMRELALCIEFKQTSTTEEQEEKDRIMFLVFEQLSRLTNLEKLQLGGSVAVKIPRGCGIELLLSKGFGKLSNLQEMKRIAVYNTEQEMGEDEVRWMIEHWRKLEIFEGALSAKRRRHEVLRKILDEGIEGHRKK